MKLYHRTTEAAAAAIQRDGCRDGRGDFLTTSVHEGVWSSNVPLDGNEGASGPVLLSVSIPVRVIAPYEWIAEGKPYREVLVPAAVMNRYSSVRVEARD